MTSPCSTGARRTTTEDHPPAGGHRHDPHRAGSLDVGVGGHVAVGPTYLVLTDAEHGIGIWVIGTQALPTISTQIVLVIGVGHLLVILLSSCLRDTAAQGQECPHCTLFHLAVQVGATLECEARRGTVDLRAWSSVLLNVMASEPDLIHEIAGRILAGDPDPAVRFRLLRDVLAVPPTIPPWTACGTCDCRSRRGPSSRAGTMPARRPLPTAN